MIIVVSFQSPQWQKQAQSFNDQGTKHLKRGKMKSKTQCLNNLTKWPNRFSPEEWQKNLNQFFQHQWSAVWSQFLWGERARGCHRSSQTSGSWGPHLSPTLPGVLGFWWKLFREGQGKDTSASGVPGCTTPQAVDAFLSVIKEWFLWLRRK